MDEADFVDVIGYLGLRKTYDEFANSANKTDAALYPIFRELISQRQMAYFGNVLFDVNLKKGKNAKLNEALEKAHEKKCFYILAMLGMMRQYTAHATKENRTAIFTLDSQFDAAVSPKKAIKARAEARAVLNELYSGRVADLNKGFISKASNDFKILFHVFDVKDDKEKARLVRDYYDFVVTKEYKNQGFSIKHLRELITLTDDGQRMKEQKFDSVRGRLNRLFDFVVFEHYQKRPQTMEDLVMRLRAASDDVDKEVLYRKEATQLWEQIRDSILNRLLPKLDGDTIKAMSKTSDDFVRDELLTDVRISEEASCFT